MSHELTDADLKYVRASIWNARNKWFDIGIELGERHTDLSTIRKRCGDDPDVCLTEMLACWLNKRGTSWADLIEALKKETVGFESLADDLESTLCRETLEVITAIEPAETAEQLTIVTLDKQDLKLAEPEGQQNTDEKDIQQKDVLLEKRKDSC